MSGRAGIIGAGPCGLFAALLLARRGFEVRVFERRPAPYPHPRAMSLTRRTAEIFMECGLLGRIEEGALDTSACDLARWCRTLAGEELGRVPLPETADGMSPCRPLHVPQTHTERVLREALDAAAPRAIEMETPVQAVHPRENGAEIELAGGRRLAFDWVVAADGASSSTRKALGIGTTGPGDMGHFLNVFFRAPLGGRLGGRPAILHYVFGGDFFEFFVAVDGKDLWLMHHFLEPGEKIEELSRERLCEMVCRAAGFESLPVKILGVSPWVMSPAVSESWRRGRVFLAGDAAARLSPAGGLGLNTGLQGVWNLAWKIGEVAAGRAGEALLETYEAERQPWALRLMGASNGNAEEIFTAVAAAMSGDWQRVREMAASSRRHIPDTSLDLGGVYEAGAFLADEPGPEEGGAVPGARVPHVPLAHGKSLVEFCGRGFLLVAGREGARWKDAQGLEALVNGMDIFGESLESLLGIGPAGAVLVRPDGVVGARFSSGGEPALATEALRKILNPPAPAPVVFP